MRGVVLLSCLFAFSVTTSGCAGFVQVDVESAVEIRGQDSSGRGAIVARDRVLTVKHVVGEAESVAVATRGGSGWVRGRVVRELPADPEPLVEIQLELAEGASSLVGFAGFSSFRVLTPGLGGGTRVRTGRGVRSLSTATLLRGDSGSPILNDSGELVGLLSGRDMSGRVLYASLSSPEPLLLGRAK